MGRIRFAAVRYFKTSPEIIRLTVMADDCVRSRATIIQSKTERPVMFELSTGGFEPKVASAVSVENGCQKPEMDNPDHPMVTERAPRFAPYQGPAPELN